MIDRADWAALVQELKDNAARLGLTWDLAVATVEDPTIPTVTFDSDASALPTPVINIGNTPIAGDRVWVAKVPPAGNYMIGRQPLPDPAHMAVESTNAVAAAGTTTSATYVDMPGPPSVTITKNYADTRLLIAFHATQYSTVLGTIARFGVSIGSLGDFDIAQLTHNLASTHLQVSGAGVYAAAVAGSVTITGRWLRVSGAGLLTIDANDWVSITVQEVI